MKIFTFSMLMIFSILNIAAQTVLAPGDMAFISTNSDGATYDQDTFAFVLLKDIDAATTIHFTDRGWNDSSGFYETPGDGKFTWNSEVARSVGDIIEVNLTPLFPAAYSTIGDQLFAYQGLDGLPSFIAGIHTNVTTGSTDTNWDGAAISNSTSALPDQLENGGNAIRFTTEFDNGQYSAIAAGGNTYSSIEDILIKINNIDNWNFSNTSPYTPPAETGIAFVLPAPCTAPDSPVLSLTANNICPGSSTTINISGNLNDATEWVIYTGSCGGIEVGSTAGTSFEVTPPNGDTTYYVRGEDGTGCVDETSGTCATITVNAGDNTPPSITCPTDIEIDNDAGTTVTYSTPVATDNCSIPQPAKANFTSLGVFNGKYYYISDNSFTPEAAFSDAESNGGNVVTINDASENSFINSVISVPSVIIGLTDKEVEGQFAWVNGEAVTYTNWAPGEPNNSNNEDYTELYSGGNWNDLPGSISRPYILEVSSGVIQTAGLPSGSEFPIGTTTNTFKVTDASGNTANCSFDVTVNDVEAPTGYLVSIDQAEIDENNQTGVSFTFAGAEVGSTYNYTFSSDNGGISVTGSGTIAAATDQITGVDLSGLEDGTITLSVTLTDAGLNEGAAVTDTKLKATNKAPVAVCKAFTAHLNASGNVTISPNDVDGGSSDDKAGFILSIDQETFDCSNIGENTVELKITDSDGVKDTCTATVTVEDNEVPTALAENITVELDETGKIVVEPRDVNNGSKDNCEIASLAFKENTTVYAQIDEGQNLTITLPEGKAVTSVDFASYGTPSGSNGDYAIGSCHATNSKSIVENYALGENTFTIPATNTVFGDPCGGTFKRLYVVVSYENPNTGMTFTCNELGDNTVNLVVTDAHGNKSAATATVTVEDKTAPNAIAQDITVQLDENGAASITAAQIDNGSSDACGIDSMTLDVYDFDCSNVGANTITLTVTDKNGNTSEAQATVTVEDKIAPAAIAQDITVQLDENGMASITADIIDSGSNDICGIAELRLDVVDFNCDNIGHNTVTLTVEDNNGNISEATGTVNVEDLIPPTVDTQDVTIYLDENGQASITGDYTVGPVAGQLEPQNSASTTAAVDCDCPEGYVAVGYEGSSGWILDDFRLMCKEVLADGSLGTEIIETCFSGSQTSLGNTKVLNDNEVLVGFQVTDGDYQHQQSSRTHVSVQGYGKSLKEVARGRLNSAENTVLGAISGSGTGTSNLMTTTKFAPAGQAIVGMSVNQTSGYSSSVSFKYAPINTLLSINNASFDNCEIASISADAYDFTCEDVGENTVTLTVTDVNGNESSATTTVTVEDNTAPIAIAKDLIVQLDENGMASITPEMIENGSSDNCTNPDALSFSLDKTEFNCENIESNNPSAIDFISENNSYFSTDATVNIPVGTQERTISLWVNPDVSDFCWGCLVQQGNGDCTSKMFGLGMSENNKLVFWGGCDDYISNLDIPNDTWTYIAISFKNGLVTLYANGESESFSKPNINTTSSKLFVGRETVNNGASFRDNFDGQIDEVRIYERALNELEVEEDKASQIPLNGVISSYTFDDKNGTDINDEEGNNNGTLFSSNGENFVEGISKQAQVTLTVTDQNGNSATATAIVTVEDNIPAEVLTQDITVQLDELGMATITPEMIDNGSNDACGIESIDLDVTDFTCENIGENIVTLTATDFNGNESSATAVVTVEDNIAAEVLTQNITVQLDELGMASITPEMIDHGSNDTCGIESLGLDITDFTCENIGENTVTLTATDVNGNESSATTMVTVEDNVAPIVETQPITVQLDANGVASITPDDIDNSSSDNCEIDTMNLDITEFSCADVDNPVTVTLAVIDINGNESSKTALVTVEDIVDPTVVTQDITVQLDANGVASISPENIDKGSSDNCEIDTMTLDISEFSCVDVDNPVTVTLTVIDVNGNGSSATATVIVEDSVAPIVETQPITVQLDANGVASITPEDIDNGSSDNCEIDTMNLDITEFSCADVDNPVTVTLAVIDINGNESSKTALVTVEDIVDPTVVTQDITVQLDANGVASISPENIDKGSSDNCEIDTMTLDISEFSCVDVDNPVTVTLTVIDVNGNGSSATATVIVEDSVAPIVETQPITVQLDANGVASITPEDIDNGSSDNCEIDTMSLDITSFVCADVDNPVTVTLTIIDVNGNESSATALVTVEDNVAPIVETQPITVQLDATGVALITPEDIDNGSSDNCGIDTMSLDITSFDCADVDNPVTVTLTVIDVNGNESSATATVIVEDNVAPVPDVAELQDVIVKCEVLTGRITAPTATGNCGVLTATTLDPLTYNEPGSYTITWNFDDGNGNTAMQTQNVIVEPSPLNEVTFDDASFVYNGSEHRLEVKNLPEGASVDYSISSEAGTQNGAINAGVYTVTANLSSEFETCPNTELTATLTILKAEAIITADATQTFTYDGTQKQIIASLNHSETELSYSPQQAFTEPGTYQVIVSSAETENYLATSKTVTVIIEKAEITGVSFESNSESFVYNGDEYSIFVTDLPENATVEYINNGQVNAGTYVVTAIIKQNGFDDLVLIAELVIEKAPQSITFDEISNRNQLDADFQLEAISTSGLPVSYSYTFTSDNPAATVSPQGLVRILGGGQIKVTALQEGNQNFEAANSVERTLTITGSDARLNSATINGMTYSNPDVEIYYLVGCGNSEDEILIELEQNIGATIDRGNIITVNSSRPGIYRETVIVTSEDGNSSTTYNIVIERNFDFEDIVIQKFNNVLLVNNNPDTNGGYKFVGYRWYKDGSVIGNNQYYSAGDNADDLLDVNSTYYVVLETEDGEFLKTCVSSIQLRSSFTIKLAPNPVVSGGTMELLTDFPKEELTTMDLSIYNLNGRLIKQLKSKSKTTSISLPYNLEVGVYILKIETKNIHKSIRFIVK